ncbi:MAG: DUF2461 domain-containing protein [Candidatus Metalachnospira sp.]|nr:DUF2461 domain-containing protein [Candidatus Metalachnospira sp.]
MAKYFEGFPPEMIDFFWELRMNNNAEWFNENRDRYDTLAKEPMKLFAEELCKKLNNMGLGEVFVPSISRANRDVRFSKDKSPYKDRKWVVFNYGEGRWQDKVCFYFEVAPEGWCCGCGTYCADSAFMARYRKKLSANSAVLKRIDKSISEQNYFKADVSMYKKNFTPESVDKDIAKWYQYKNIALISDYSISNELFSHEISDIVEEKFKFMKQFFMYFKDI